MKKILIILIFFVINFLNFSCKQKPTSVPTQQKSVTTSTAEKQKEQTVELTKKEVSVTFPKYTYEGLSYRDPFLPLSGEKIAKAKLAQQDKNATVPSLGTLQLKGFIIDKHDRIALFSSPYGSYILVNGKLYDNLNRLVKGVSGEIIFDLQTKQPKNVILVTENNEYKEYKLKE